MDQSDARPLWLLGWEFAIRKLTKADLMHWHVLNRNPSTYNSSVSNWLHLAKSWSQIDGHSKKNEPMYFVCTQRERERRPRKETCTSHWGIKWEICLSGCTIYMIANLLSKRIAVNPCSIPRESHFNNSIACIRATCQAWVCIKSERGMWFDLSN